MPRRAVIAHHLRWPAIAIVATAAIAPPAHAASRILYVSNWSGYEQIYAADPSGREPLAEVSELDPSGNASALLPSPDGRHVLFRGTAADQSTDYRLTRTDGAGPVHRLASGFVSAAWSPDGRLLAYIAQPAPTQTELRVLRADGTDDHRISSLPAGDTTIRWSRDGRHVHASAPAIGCCSVSYSADGRWIAYERNAQTPQVFVVSSRARQPRITVGGWSPAWSPDGRLLAYVDARGLNVLDVRTRATRLLASGPAAHLAWSPDGDAIAYVVCCGQPEFVPSPTTTTLGDVRTVTLTGLVRVVIAASAVYGGVVTDLAWTRAPYATYRRPPVPTGVYTVTDVTSLSAEGDRVVYAACGGLFAWTPATRSVSPLPVVEPISNYPNWCGNVSIYDVTVTDDSIGYATIHGGNNRYWELHELLRDGSTLALPEGDAQYGAPTEGRLAGAGGTLVYAAADGVQIVGGATLVAASGEPERPTLLDVDGDHVLVGRAQDVEVFDVATGEKQLQLSIDGDPSAPLAARYPAPADMRLTGQHLAVRSGDVLYDYDLSGAIGHTWQLSPGARLLDADHGLVAYTAADTLHVLRLSDGADKVVAAATMAHFMNEGLAYANGAHVDVVPNALLPR